MGNFDKIIKENMVAIFTPLLEKLLNLSIKATSEIKDKLQVTIEREPDFLKRIIDKDDREFILQLEFQTQNDPGMRYRMAEYKAILQRKFHVPVRQFVIYLGKASPKMQTELSVEEQITGFELRNITELSTAAVLDSQIPEEIILAVLTDYPAADAESIIVQIIRKLRETSADESQLRRTIQQLLILSRLRNLETITEEKTTQMAITYNITEDGLYKKGLEQGLEKGLEQGLVEGLEQGLEKGIEQGAQSTKKRMILKALQLGVLTAEQIAEMAEVDLSYVLQVRDKNGY